MALHLTSNSSNELVPVIAVIAALISVLFNPSQTGLPQSIGVIEWPRTNKSGTTSLIESGMKWAQQRNQ